MVAKVISELKSVTGLYKIFPETGACRAAIVPVQSNLLSRPPIHKDHLVTKTRIYRPPGVYIPFFLTCV